VMREQEVAPTLGVRRLQVAQCIDRQTVMV